MDLKVLFDRLNDEQKEAALDIYGPSMIIAGPGAGKTYTLVVRTANMIANGINGENIVLFTFTKKAANEIKERVIEAIGDKAKSITVGTYHSVCSRLLRKYAEYVGLTKSYSIFDTEDCKKIMKEIVKVSGLDFEVDKVLSYISSFKSQLINPSEALRNSQNSIENQLAQLYQLYENKLLQMNGVDFDGLIYKTVRLLDQYSDVKREINRQYQYIVADESHDSSEMDLRLIYLLSNEYCNLCMIADNDQSIYSFRGAKIEAVMNMRNIFPNMCLHLLNTNYRSTKTIVEASKSLINKNTVLVEKHLRSNNEEGNPIIQFLEKDPKEEAIRIVKLIKLCVEKHGYKYSDIAILYRMNYLSRQIEDALLKYRIPYKIVGGINFYSRKEIKDIMSYFRLILNPYDVIAFNRAVSNPKIGVGEKTVEKIISYSIENNCTILKAMSCVIKSGKGKIASEKFINIITTLSQDIEYEKPEELINKMLKLTGYVDYINKSEKANIAEERLQNIEELMEIARHFETMEELSNNITLDSTVNEEENENCVQLLTMHSSKGLEWNVVIVAGVVEGVTPSYRAETFSQIEEERRLCYVAFTRAKKLLFITSPKFIINKGSYMKARLSRFVKEIDKQYIYNYA